MPIRRALSTIRLTHWADVEPLLRLRTTEHSPAGRRAAQTLGRMVGRGLRLEAVIVVDDSAGEASVLIDAESWACWGVGPADVWARAVANNVTAAASAGRNEAVASRTYQDWYLTLTVGKNRVAVKTNQLLDRHRSEATVWWSVLSAKAMVLLHPPDRSSEFTSQHAWELVAGLTSETDDPFERNLFVSGGCPNGPADEV